MPCLDELTLELWLAEALAPAEAAGAAGHLATCAACEARLQAHQREAGSLVAALALEADELAFLDGLRLAARWRRPQPATWWGWLALLAALGSLLAWELARPLAGPALEVAGRVGLWALLADAGFRLLWAAGQALLTLASSPALGYSLPALGALGLALLFGPRLTPAAITRAAE